MLRFLINPIGGSIMRHLVFFVLGLCVVGGNAALASDLCNSPMKEWQPRESLQAKLEADGWKVNQITIDDGCYEAYATDAQGRRVEAYFDPKTFDLVKTDLED
jgi:hypothetical protein